MTTKTESDSIKRMDEINRLYLEMRTARIKFKLAQAKYKTARYEFDLEYDNLANQK